MREWEWVFGRLGWSDIVFVEAVEKGTLSAWIAAGAGFLVVAAALGVVVLLTLKGYLRPLWRDWLTTLDHKKVGIMYIILALVMFARALVETILMRLQQAAAVGSEGFLSGDHFGQLFTTHGTIMIFFMAMPFLTGLINDVMPLQIGARDVSFPMLNAVSLMPTLSGASLLMVSLVIGKFSTGGWTAYPPFHQHRLQSGCRRGLLDLGDHARLCRINAHRHQIRGHDL